MLFELIRAMVEDGMGTWLRADPVGRLFAQPARRRDAAASARRRAEFMEDPHASGLAVLSCADLSRPNTAESGTRPGSDCGRDLARAFEHCFVISATLAHGYSE